MRLYVKTLFFLLCVAFLPTNVSALGVKDIKGSDYKVLSKYNVNGPSYCPYNKQVKIAQGEQIEACILSSDRTLVAKYQDTRYRDRLGVNFNNGTELYPVMMNGDYFNCTYSLCLYSSVNDTLINLEFVINSYSFSPVIYHNFTKNMTISDTSTGRVINYNNPERDIMRATPEGPAYLMTAGSMALSNNEKWLVIELIDHGIFRFNLEDGSFLRFYDDILEHSTAGISHSEFAINDAGDTVVHMGINAGFNIYTINQDCGDESLLRDRMSRRCPAESVNTDKVIWQRKFATSPYITSSGTLSFISYSVDGMTPPVYAHIAPVTNLATTPPASLDILALGDSFISGEGETDSTYYLQGTTSPPEACHTSFRSHPYLVAQYLDVIPGRVKSVACSGAVMADINGHSSYMGQRGRLKDLITPTLTKTNLENQALENFLPGRVAQSRFAAIAQPSALIVSVGGNDSGLMSKLGECATPGTCKWVADDYYKKAVEGEITGLHDKLVKTYNNLLSSSPGSTIHAIGYPKFISTARDCSSPEGLLFNQSERVFIEESIKLLNTTIEAAAIAAGITYVDIEDAFGDNLICNNHTVAAMNGVILRSIKDVQEKDNLAAYVLPESFHPTPFGHELIASAIVGSISLDNPYPHINFNTPDPISVSPFWSDSAGYSSNPSKSTVPILKQHPLFDNFNHLYGEDLGTRGYPLGVGMLPGSLASLVIEKDGETFRTINVSIDNSGFPVIDANLHNLQKNIETEEGVYTAVFAATTNAGEDIVLYDTFIANSTTPALDEYTPGDDPVLPEDAPQEPFLPPVDGGSSTPIDPSNPSSPQSPEAPQEEPNLPPVNNASPPVTSESQDENYLEAPATGVGIPKTGGDKSQLSNSTLNNSKSKGNLASPEPPLSRRLVPASLNPQYLGKIISTKAKKSPKSGQVKQAMTENTATNQRSRGGLGRSSSLGQEPTGLPKIKEVQLNKIRTLLGYVGVVTIACVITHLTLSYINRKNAVDNIIKS